MLNRSNWIWSGSASPGYVQPYFTSDLGSSFSVCMFTGGVTAGGGGWISMGNDDFGNVLLFNDGSGSTNGSGAAGTWKLTNTSSCAFTQQSTTNLVFAKKLLPVPDRACNFVIASLQSIWGSLPGFGNAYLTTDCGVHWSRAIAGINSVLAIGIGKPQSGHGGYASLYYQGWYNNGSTNTFGLWEVDDINTTPVFTDLDPGHSAPQKGYPCGNMDFVSFIQGDGATAGTVAFGFLESGGCYRTN